MPQPVAYRSRPSWFDILLVGLTVFWDSLSVALAFYLAYTLRAAAPNTLYGPEFYWSLAQFTGIATVLVFAASGLYRVPGYQARFDEAAKSLIGLTIAFTLVIAGVFFFREASFSRLVLLTGWGTSALLIVSGRLALQQLNQVLRQQGFGLRQVLVVGTGPTARSLGTLLADNPQWGLKLAGLVAEKPDVQTSPGPPVVANFTTLGQHLASNEVAEVWFAVPELPRPQLSNLLQVILSVRPVQIRMVPDVLEYLTARVQVDVLGGTPLLTLRDTPLRFWYNRTLKRLLDIVLSCVALLVGAPLLFLIALAVKATSPGPVLYQQERIGRDGSVFWIYKFRSMRIDAERQGPGWTIKDDPRRTPLGAFLRRSSLDELPQLWNVLKGEMSLVGPRPERPVYVDRFSQEIPKYLDRHLVKAGITGWAQIHGLRGDTSIAERVRYDLYYIENWSLLLDLRILISTVWRVLFDSKEVY